VHVYQSILELPCQVTVGIRVMELGSGARNYPRKQYRPGSGTTLGSNITEFGKIGLPSIWPMSKDHCRNSNSLFSSHQNYVLRYLIQNIVLLPRLAAVIINLNPVPYITFYEVMYLEQHRLSKRRVLFIGDGCHSIPTALISISLILA
jgi:hypothetical protein